MGLRGPRSQWPRGEQAPPIGGVFAFLGKHTNSAGPKDHGEEPPRIIPVGIDGTSFRLGLLDTGVVSEILKNRNDERLALGRLLTGESMIPSISIWSILELRRRPDLYSIFLQLFSVVPFFLLRDSYHLLQDELQSYPRPAGVDPVAFTFSPYNPDPQAHLRQCMRKLFSSREVKEGERA